MYLLRALYFGVMVLLAGMAASLAQPVPQRLNVPDLPFPDFDYETLDLPAHLAPVARLDSAPADNPVTNAGAALGRVIFYDNGLSANRLVSCASCHNQALGFDDSTRFPIGFAGRITRRGAMPLANARFNPRGSYFRDERAATLEEQVLHPFTDEIEMGLKPGELVERVSARDWYGPLFADAFGDEAVTEDRVSRALAQFVRSIVSIHSSYDVARAQAGSPMENFPQFTAAENRGKFLYFTPRTEGGAGCSACHETEAFLLLRPRNNGTHAGSEADDGGLGEISGTSTDLGLFRAASLKNIAVSAPYMHDGRFETLEQVIDHYADGVQPHANLDRELQGEGGKPFWLDFNEADRHALVAFLETLTDGNLLRDPKFSDPFARRGQ